MSPTVDAFLRSWPAEPWLTAVLALTAAIYWRGWLVLRRHDEGRWGVSRLAAFLGGLAAIFLALASPIEPFAPLLLQVHMVQHLLLMMVAPPLLWLGAPMMPLLRGLPREVRRYWVTPLFRSRRLRHVFATLTHPLVAWPLYVAATWLWHTPAGYQLALSRNDWHFAEHLSFVVVSLLFWYPVVRPYPSRPRWSQWLLFPYLLLADVQNTVLAAWLTFSGNVIYPHYEQVPRIGGITAIDDQAAAGAIMWVPGSIAFLLPLVWIGFGLLSGGRPSALRKQTRTSTAPHHGFDLLRFPTVGRFVRWRYSRQVMQAVLAAVGVVVILDGMMGPQVSPMNLAGVLPWIHWRGMLVFGLLVAGNVFCMACPFTLPRTVARRWLPARLPWPQWLRNKWLAAGLMAIFLWSYEAFDLWDSPWLTAWIAIGYFVAAFVVDATFHGGVFCKYVCPIGQFNFVQSLVSPLEVKVRSLDTCHTCRTKDCIRGNSEIAGCELALFQPRKSGNLDCTFCLDCVRACPHENVGLLAVVPASTLWSDPLRSGLGRFSRRRDIAALVLVLVFVAFANAAGMVGPVVEWQDRLRALTGNLPEAWITTIFYFSALILIPLISVSIAATLSRIFCTTTESWPPIATRYTYALIPLGFSMWLAHYSFHLLTSYETVIPATQRFAADFGMAGLGEPAWSCSCCRPAMPWVRELQIVMLDCGLLLSLYTGFRIAEEQTSRIRQAAKVFLPWLVLIVSLFALGIWIVFQPMQIRGTLPMAG